MGPVGSGGVRLSQTRPIPRSPDGDKNLAAQAIAVLVLNLQGSAGEEGAPGGIGGVCKVGVIASSPVFTILFFNKFFVPTTPVI